MTNPTKKNLEERPKIEATTKVIKLISKNPEARVKTLYGIGVNPETGSQYLIKNGKPEVDENGEFKKPEKTISSQEYWENYFKIHPEIKPSKIMYGSFRTSNYKENMDLKKFAEGKEIRNQDECKKEEFLEYSKSSHKILRDIFSDVVQEVYSSTE